MNLLPSMVDFYTPYGLRSSYETFFVFLGGGVGIPVIKRTILMSENLLSFMILDVLCHEDSYDSSSYLLYNDLAVV